MANSLDALTQGQLPDANTDWTNSIQPGDAPSGYVQANWPVNPLQQITTLQPDYPPDSILGKLAALRDYLANTQVTEGNPTVKNIVNNLTSDRPGKPRYQTFPERILRSGATIADDLMSGKISHNVFDPVTGELVPNPEVTERAMDMAAMAGGGFAGFGRDAVGTGTNLRVLGRQLLSDTNKPGAAIAGLTERSNPSKVGDNIGVAPMPAPKNAPTLEPIRGLEQALTTLEMAKAVPGTPEQWAGHFKELPEVQNALMLPEFKQYLNETGKATGTEVADFLKKVQAIPEKPKAGVTDMDRRSFIRGAASVIANAPRIMKYVGKALEAQPTPEVVAPRVKLENPAAAIKYGMSPEHEKTLLDHAAQVLQEDNGWTADKAMKEAKKAWRNDPEAVMGEHGPEALDVGDYHHRAYDRALEATEDALEEEFQKLPADVRAKYETPEMEEEYGSPSQAWGDSDEGNEIYYKLQDEYLRSEEDKKVYEDTHVDLGHRYHPDTQFESPVPIHQFRLSNRGPDDGQVHVENKATGEIVHSGTPQSAKEFLQKNNNALLSDTNKPGAAIAALKSVPGRSLRPAIAYNGRVFKAKPGQEHADALPAHLYEDFMEKAMKGEDLKEYKTGFVDHQGRFLSREAALDYAIKEGLVDPHAARYGMLTTSLLADSSKPGVAIEALAKSKSPFYSAVEHAVENAPQETMQGAQWAGWLKNQPGVKKEELDWTGVHDWLAGQKGKVSRGDIQKYLDEHKTELKDVTKTGDKAISESEAEDIAEDEIRNQNPEFADRQIGDGGDWGFSDAVYRRTQEILRDQEGSVNRPKYSDYQLPGGENYREHLITKSEKVPVKQVEDWAKRVAKGAGVDWDKLPEDKRLQHLDEAKKLLSESRTPENPYKSSHWDEPNVLAHVRTNDRTMGGKKSLHLEEIQSDWHQEGRKKGYNDGGITNEERSELDKLKSKIQTRSAEANDLERYNELVDKVEKSRHGVPDAPFKTSWPELALKRMIRHAAENGYDRISWTPGEAQAARYDLSKQVKALEYDMESGYLGGYDINHRVLTHHYRVKPDKLPDIIGKEAAEKILNSPTRKEGPNRHVLEGVDLRVGGEGMREFYDRMLPKIVEKIGKAHGVKVQLNAGKVGRLLEDELKNRGLFQESFDRLSLSQRNNILEKVDALAPVHYFDLPQSLKDQALHKGFPLFAKGIPFPLTPVDHDPFKKDKSNGR